MTEEITPAQPPAIPETTGLVDKAMIAADRIEAALKKQEELAARMENIMAKQMLGGRAEAGAVIKPKTDEDIATEWAEQMAKRFK